MNEWALSLRADQPIRVTMSVQSFQVASESLCGCIIKLLMRISPPLKCPSYLIPSEMEMLQHI